MHPNVDLHSNSMEYEQREVRMLQISEVGKSIKAREHSLTQHALNRARPLFLADCLSALWLPSQPPFSLVESHVMPDYPEDSLTSLG